MLACRELSGLLRRDVQLLVRQNRPKVPLTTRNLYLQARPVEVYPVIYALLPGYAADSPRDLAHHVCLGCSKECLCQGLGQSSSDDRAGQSCSACQGASAPMRLMSCVRCTPPCKVCEHGLRLQLWPAGRGVMLRLGMWQSSPLAQTQGMMQLPLCTACMLREPPATSSTCAATLAALCLLVCPHLLNVFSPFTGQAPWWLCFY